MTSTRYIADYPGAEPVPCPTQAEARDLCDEYAALEANGRHCDWTDQGGILTQFWTHPDTDAQLGYTGAEVRPSSHRED